MSISQVNASQSLRAAAAISALRSNAAPTAPAAIGGPARQADAVSLSDSARALASARKSIADAADVREDRVAALKAAIADGSYTIDSRQLARSMVKKLVVS
jgi:negative regulator of flagellin synthesis FlgM